MGRGFRTVLLFVAGVFLLACGLGLAQGKEATPPVGVEGEFDEKVPLLAVGAVAPEFRLAEIDGPEYSYGGEGRGKPLLLVFFSLFCEPCRAELSVLQKIRGKYGGGLDVAAVSLDGEVLKSTVAGFAKQEGYTFRILMDEVTERQTFRVAETYRVTEMPTLYLLDGSGRIAFAGTGRVPEDTLGKAVTAAIKK
jgi:thiol-disulfide isomerase/thioredoxin